ncbi:MAG TPA: ribosome maturation factor RimP [Acidimicrobiales bacterium]|nr:ribosome maturation factor RimP [Acidimicrobiales bacterium]
MGQAEKVRALVEPVLATEGLELFDCEVKPGLLRVTVDAAEGVDAERLGKLSQRLSRLLDEQDPIPDRYTLEVSTPGLERPLRTPDHFRKAIGTEITVRTTGETEGERRVQGVLDSADDEGIVVASRRITYDHIDRARTVFQWGGQPKPGSKSKQKKAAS